LSSFLLYFGSERRDEEVNEPMKKNHINLKLKSTSLTVLLLSVFLFAALSGTQLIKEASAIPYTQYTGTLDGADWALRIPDPWNGMLVIICRGYGGPTWMGVPLNFLNWGSSMLESGYAIAASNYGSAGFCIQAAINATHQLTNQIIANYSVTGKVFLYGRSMGGAVALLLGEKYPEIYSGVLDANGVKDFADIYTLSKSWSNMTDEELGDELTALGIPVPPPDYDTLQELRDKLASGLPDMELETGGTPETHPQEYEDRSPVHHANIEIPVIVVHGAFDVLVPLYESIAYQDAVALAGHSDLYRLYSIPEGYHMSDSVLDEVPARFIELVEWSNYLTGDYDWPMFGHDPQCTGYTDSPAPDTNQTLWTSTVSVGGGTCPAVVNDRLYIGDWSGRFYCFDAANGTELWRYQTGAEIISNSAVVDGRAYVGSMDNNTYCFNATTGVQIWNYTTGAGVWSSSVVVNGKVYFGSEDTNIYCLDAADGTLIWNYTTDDSVHFTAFAEEKVYAGSYDDDVYCLDAADGTLIWNYTTGGNVFSAPTIADGRVYVGSFDKSVYCLNATNGGQIWNYTTGGWVYSSPAVADARIYVGSMDRSVYCLNATTGAQIWNYTTGAGVYSSPAVADGRIYVGSQDRDIYCLDADDGSLVWTYETASVIYDGLAISNGVVYTISGMTVYAIGSEYVVPEGFDIGVVLLLSAAVALFGFSLSRKRPKLKELLLKKS